MQKAFCYRFSNDLSQRSGKAEPVSLVKTLGVQNEGIVSPLTNQEKLGRKDIVLVGHWVEHPFGI